VTNWTLSNCERLMEVPVNVGAKANVRRALEVLVETAKANAAVLKNPSPQAIIVTLAAASTSLKLRCWLDAEEDWMKVTSEINLALQAALEKEGIGLA
jgi:small-conductance mechanosensitive channel